MYHFGVIKYLSIILLSLNVQAQLKSTQLLKKTEQIFVRMLASGDFKAEYEFSGTLGSELKADVGSGGAKPMCDISSLFRKLKYRGKNTVEAWLTLECTNKGQKSIYKPHRIYLDPTISKQKVRLPMLDKNLKNVQLEFQELSLKLGK